MKSLWHRGSLPEGAGSAALALTEGVPLTCGGSYAKENPPNRFRPSR